jgi:nitroimidazol reductase NimA-like FMN-containing flavoprotein (pyridoxamine 5'-phosphate oxidase superfamily)
MFRKLRYAKRALSEEEALKILEEGVYGVLALAGDEGYPYAVPLNYAYEAGKLYFHCAPAGHKLDAIQNSDKASFCVVARAEVAATEFTCHYRSAVAFGRARLVTDAAEKRKGLDLLVRKYSPDYLEAAEKDIKADWDRVAVARIDVEHLSAKGNV